MKANKELREKVRVFMTEWFHLPAPALARKAANTFRVFHEPKWLDEMAAEIAYPFPGEQLGCGGDCGFTRTGQGWQCTERAGCGRFVGPGDKGYGELTEYYRRAQSRNRRT